MKQMDKARDKDARFVIVEAFSCFKNQERAVESTERDGAGDANGCKTF